MTYLEPDEAQEYRNAARKLAQMAQIQYEALLEMGFPDPITHDLMVEWWKQTMRPTLPDFPDITKLFGLSE